MPLETYAQDIVDTVREPLLMLDTTLRVHSANRAFYQTFQVSLEETENHLIYELGNGQWDIPALRTLLEDIVPKNSVFSDFELAHTFPVIGRRVMLLNARQLKAGNHGELLVLAMEDVTERRRAEEEAALARGTAEAANRTKSLFLANMSHELRTPLNAILGYSEMLQEEAADQGVLNFLPDLQKIHIAGKHLLLLINDILDLSKIEAGKMELHLETFSIPGLIEGVVETIRPLINANANMLCVRCPAELGTMYADMTKIRQSLFNLLSNAAKFTEQGTIVLEVSRETMEDREWISFRVSDTGIGITAEQLVKLFQTFSQADTSTTRKFGGSGLGLVLTRRFCQLMGGDVTVDSVPGTSSAFTIKVPARVSAVEPSATGSAIAIPQPDPQAGAIVEVSGPGATQALILVVDDNKMNRDVLSRRLERQGYGVVMAENGREAMEVVRARAFDLVLLDIMMPEMDGYAVLQQLKADAALRPIPVIMISALDEMDSVVRCIEMGAEDYLPKPFDPTLLKARIGACLDKKRAHDREMRLFGQCQQSYRRLQELEKLRDDLTHMIIHDLRTPLTSVILGIQTLDVLGDLNTNQQEMMSIALKGGATLLDMINDLLDISKMESGALQLDYAPLSAAELAAGAIGQVAQLAANSNITLTQRIAAELPPFNGDANKLHRTLVNLLGNAIKFTLAGGTVTLAVQQAERQTGAGVHTRADVPTGTGGCCLLFAVSDTGEGIPPESFGRIFEKFGQVESRQRGRMLSTGLGLTFCKLAVEAHGGSIKVDSVPNCGSTFSFAIPLVEQSRLSSTAP